MVQSIVSDSHERVLNAAERLFSERGYTAVKLRDIADALGIRQASLYHHAPGGKEQLFVDVTERSMERHRVGMEQAISQSRPDDLREQLRAAARWLLSQPPINLSRMNLSDMPAIAPSHAQRLKAAAARALLAPLEAIYQAAIDRGEIRSVYPHLMAGMFLSVIEGVQQGAPHAPVSKQEMADDVIDILLKGMYQR